MTEANQLKIIELLRRIANAVEAIAIVQSPHFRSRDQQYEPGTPTQHTRQSAT
jgi:hypothetical protein